MAQPVVDVSPAPRVPASTRRWVVVLTGIGSLMAALDTLVVGAALNTIRRDLHASLSQLEWTVNAYNLSFAVLLIAAAAIGDRLGRRTVYGAGLVLFAVASAGCALAPNVSVLILMRAVQGMGAATFVSGFKPAIIAAAALSWCGCAAALALPSRRRDATLQPTVVRVADLAAAGMEAQS